MHYEKMNNSRRRGLLKHFFLFTIILISIIIPAVCIYADYYSTVYTSYGTSITVVVNTYELDYSEIESYNNFNALNYPYASRLREPTRYYNCHSYAWYSQLSSNPYWMFSPASYWLDGSYNQLDITYNCAIPSWLFSYYTKVYYSPTVPGNSHSAIKPADSSYFVSKWGAAGLYQHYPQYCPYYDTAYATVFYN